MRRTGSVKKNTGKVMTIFQGGEQHEETQSLGLYTPQARSNTVFWSLRKSIIKKFPRRNFKEPRDKGGRDCFRDPPRVVRVPLLMSIGG